MRRRHKYGAESTIVDGIRFPSKHEAMRYVDLKLLERAGHIRALERQPAFPLTCGGVPVRYESGRQAKYVADFRYVVVDSRETIVEDAKGHDTPASKLKRAILLAETGIRVRLV